MASILDVAAEFQARVADLEQRNGQAVTNAALQAEKVYQDRSLRVTQAVNKITVLHTQLVQISQDLGAAIDALIATENHASREFTKSIDSLHNVVDGATSKRITAQ